jgi:hypothetical protein
MGNGCRTGRKEKTIPTINKRNKMKWIPASELKDKDPTREYIGKWRKEFVNSGQFSEDGAIFHFDSGKYASVGNFEDLYILVKEDESAKPSPGYTKEQMWEEYRKGHHAGWMNDIRPSKETYLRSLPPAKDAGVLVDAIEKSKQWIREAVPVLCDPDNKIHMALYHSQIELSRALTLYNNSSNQGTGNQNS